MLTPLYAAAAGATAAHPYNLEVNATDVIARVPMESIRIEMGGIGTNGSMTFTVLDDDATVSIAEWDEVTFTEHAATRPVLFGGFVQSVRYSAWAAVGRTLEVTCVGYGILLDKKVVPSFDVPNDFVGEHVVSVTNRHGGRVTGTAVTVTGRNDYATDTEHSIANPTDWWWAIPPVSGRPDITAPALLRGVFDYWAELSSDKQYIYTAGMADDEPTPSTGMSYWVDSYARLHAHPMLDASLGAANVNWDGTCPVAISESTGAGLVRASSHDFELENTDLLTRVYVVGGNADGTGYAGRAGHQRAGDLEAIVSEPESTTTELRQSVGDGSIARTQASEARGTSAVDSATPIDFRPGQKLLVSSTGLGLSSEAFRITGVSIAFLSLTQRRYTVNWGGQLVSPSAMNRSGRYAQTRRS